MGYHFKIYTWKNRQRYQKSLEFNNPKENEDEKK